MTHKDKLYQKPRKKVEAFRFTEEVVQVFDDMIQRSVPGYNDLLNHIGLLTKQHVQDQSHVYDLGCSTGNSLLAIMPHISALKIDLFGVDTSEAMLKTCQERIQPLLTPSLSFHPCMQSLTETTISNAAAVIMNFTLQFVPPDQRNQVLQNIHQGLNPGGILILSEKVQFKDSAQQERFTDWHHAFKKQQGYSQLEISQKRAALENVLISDTQEQLIQRFSQAGFSNVWTFFQQLQFVSMVAIK